MSNQFRLSPIAAALALGCAAISPGAHADSGAQVGSLLTFGTLNSSLNSPHTVVARSSNGSFAVSWQLQDDSTHFHRVAQIYNADGTAVSDAFTISSKYSFNTALAMDSDGDLIAAWFEGKTDSLSSYNGAIHAQRYNSAGVAQGNEITVAPYAGRWLPFVVGLSQAQPDQIQVAVDDDGDFAIGWSEVNVSFIATGYLQGWVWESSATHVKVYNANGKLLRNKVVDQVPTKKFPLTYGTGTDNMDVLGGMAMNGKGDMVLVYSSFRDGQQQPMLAQRLYKTLQQIPAPAALDGAMPSPHAVGIDASGNFVLESTILFSNSVTIGHYSSTGALLGSHSIPYSAGALSVAPNGSYVATYNIPLYFEQPDGTTLTSAEVHAQYYNSDDSLNGADVLIDDGKSQLNAADAVAAGDANNNLVVVWSELAPVAWPQSPQSVVGRLVTAPPAP